MVRLRRIAVHPSAVLVLCLLVALTPLSLAPSAVAGGRASSVSTGSAGAIPAKTAAMPAVAKQTPGTGAKSVTTKAAQEIPRPAAAKKTATAKKVTKKKVTTAKKVTKKKVTTAKKVTKKKVTTKKPVTTKRAAKKAAKPTAAQLKSARKAAASGGVAALTTLHGLPGSGGVTIAWHEPALGSHLGGVWIGSTTTILLNARRLRSNPSLARDVVRHEIAHIYQGRIMRTYHLTWAQLGRKMAPAFGANSQEKAADCVARYLGARWTGYTSACSGTAKRTWVKAMIGGYLPKK